jgi:hypothetical protein
MIYKDVYKTQRPPSRAAAQPYLFAFTRNRKRAAVTCTAMVRPAFAVRLALALFRGGTGPVKKVAEFECGLKDRLHPPLSQGLEIPHEFEHAEFPFFLPPEGRPKRGAECIIEQNEKHAAIEIT